MKQRTKSLTFTVLRIVLGLGLALFLISKTMERASLTPARLWQNICAARPGLLVLAVALHGLVLILGSWRWQLLLNAQNIHATWWNAFKLTLIGFFFNLAVPGAVGGDVAKMGYLAKLRKGQAAEGFFSIVVDRMFGVLGLFFIAAGAVLISLPNLSRLPETALIRNASYLVGLGSIVGILGLLALEFHDKLLNLPGLRNCWPLLKRLSPKAVTDLTMRMMTALDTYKKRKPVLLLVLLISISVHSVLAMDLFVIGKAMHESTVPLREYFLTTQLSNAIASVPLTPGGVGLRDKMTQESFIAFGMHPDDAAIIPITLTFIILLWAMVGLLAFVTGPGSHRDEEDQRNVKREA